MLLLYSADLTSCFENVLQDSLSPIFFKDEKEVKLSGFLGFQRSSFKHLLGNQVLTSLYLPPSKLNH